MTVQVGCIFDLRRLFFKKFNGLERKKSEKRIVFQTGSFVARTKTSSILRKAWL